MERAIIWLLHFLCALLVQSQDVQNITRCNGGGFDRLLCPLDKVIHVTRVYAGVSQDPRQCIIDDADCTIDITADNFPDEYEAFITACENRSACAAVTVAQYRVMCGQTPEASDYVTVEYTCIYLTDKVLRQFCLPRLDYFHRALCPVGTQIEIYDLYTGRAPDGTEPCTLDENDCMYTANEHNVNFFKGYCDGGIACNNDIRYVSAGSVPCDGSGEHYLVLQYTCERNTHDETLSVRSEVNTPINAGLCPVGSGIQILDGYSLANTTEDPVDGIIATNCVRQLDRDTMGTADTECNGMIACTSLALSAVNVRCPSSQMLSTHVMLIYTCLQTSTEEISDISCTENISQTISCPDNLVVYSGAYFAFDDSRSCDTSTAYQVGDCVLTYESVIGAAFDECVDMSETCWFVPPRANDRQCSGVTYGVNLYFMVVYHCQTATHTSTTCVNETVNITCSEGNVINVESASYIVKRTTQPDSTCPVLPECTPADELCETILDPNSTVYEEILQECQSRQTCQNIVVSPGTAQCFIGVVTEAQYLRIRYTCLPGIERRNQRDPSTTTIPDVTYGGDTDVTTPLGGFTGEPSGPVSAGALPPWMYIVPVLLLVVIVGVTIAVVIVLKRRKKKHSQDTVTGSPVTRETSLMVTPGEPEEHYTEPLAVNPDSLQSIETETPRNSNQDATPDKVVLPSGDSEQAYMNFGDSNITTGHQSSAGPQPSPRVRPKKPSTRGKGMNLEDSSRFQSLKEVAEERAKGGRHSPDGATEEQGGRDQVYGVVNKVLRKTSHDDTILIENPRYIPSEEIELP